MYCFGGLLVLSLVALGIVDAGQEITAVAAAQDLVAIAAPACGCWFQGTYHAHGTQFRHQCNRCWCKNGNVACTKIGCLGCTVGDTWYREGATYKISCNTCTCIKGQSVCTKIACRGECKQNCNVYANGARWFDGCNWCSCWEGSIGCSRKLCHCVTDNGKVLQHGEVWCNNCGTRCVCQKNGKLFCNN